MCGPLAQNRGDGHRSLVTPERVLSEYNEDLIFLMLQSRTYPVKPFSIQFAPGTDNTHLNNWINFIYKIHTKLNKKFERFRPSL